MTTTLDAAMAKAIAASQGIAMGDDAARDAALSMAGLLGSADAHARALAFEAEPGSYVAAQRRGKR
jgi:hypothetical protein